MNGPTSETVESWFTYHPATPITGPIHDNIRATFRAAAHGLIDLLPEGPDKTLALRKLQEAMWSANACVANAQTEDQPARNPHSQDSLAPRKLAIEYSDEGGHWQRMRGTSGAVSDWEVVPNVERVYRVVLADPTRPTEASPED